MDGSTGMKVIHHGRVEEPAACGPQTPLIDDED